MITVTLVCKNNHKFRCNLILLINQCTYKIKQSRWQIKVKDRRNSAIIQSPYQIQSSCTYDQTKIRMQNQSNMRVKINIIKALSQCIKIKQQVAESLRNPVLRSVKKIILYYLWTLGYNLVDIKSQRLICSALMSLPELQSVLLIANRVKSLDGFKSLGSKFNASEDEGWQQKEQW